jgi:hypothetical protein
VILHDGIDGGDHNTSKADCSIDGDVEKWVAVNRGKSRGVDLGESWIDEKSIHIRRRGSFLEGKLLIS